MQRGRLTALSEALVRVTALVDDLAAAPEAVRIADRPGFLLTQPQNDPQPIIERLASAKRLTFVVRALRGRTVVDASCDGQGIDDVRLSLDDGTAIALDATTVHETVGPVDLGLRGRLTVSVGGPELSPAADDANVPRR